jgi:Flp pilus assembly protein TadD
LDVAGWDTVACWGEENEKQPRWLATESHPAHLISCMRVIKISLGARRKVKKRAMSGKPLKLIVTIAVMAGSLPFAWAGDVLKITLPRRSELTPVQRLNREGVEDVKKRQYEKATALFYKAYLYDPADPFTLNNLGYVSELQGEVERAQKFYALASEQGSDANIDRSNAKELQGKPMQTAFVNLQDVPMRVNRMNLDAMNLLAENRGFEAIALLGKAQTLDPRNPFTLNNLGVADEAVGDYDNALKNYAAAYDMRSKEAVVVTQDRAWRGKPVSSMAAASARRLGDRIKKMNTTEAGAAVFARRGVSAINQNDWATARQDFLQAYSLDPSSAFSLNNRGFVAEMDGDLETAQFYYDKARKAGDANARVGLATQHSAEGERLFAVAADSNKQVDSQLEKYSQERRSETGPIELTPRENTPASPQQPH